MNTELETKTFGTKQTSIPQKQKKHLGKLFFFLILALSLGLASVAIYSYVFPSPERAAKRDREISRITDKDYKQDKLCEQYALKASRNAWFPCFKCGGKDSIFLYRNEIWKYGKTCNGQDTRYPSGLPYVNLFYFREFIGSEKDCLIQEKQKIYNYPNLPECKKRNIVLLRPPGNKIDR